ncbi:glycosyltransferase [Pediococcus acidilactici]
MKIGTVIVTFNPRINLLEKVISHIHEQVDYICVVDNNSKNKLKVKEYIKSFDNAAFIELEKNFGIAKAQNKGFKFFDVKNYDWVLTLDQDTILPYDYVDRLISRNIAENVGILTGAYVDKKWNAEQIKIMKSKRRERIQSISEEISSGNLVLIKAWKNVKGFDEQLFIDYVDFDFDYKLIRAGYKIYRVNEIEFAHEIGEPIKGNFLKYLLLLHNRDMFDHSPERMFYINRNRIIVRKRYPEFGSPIKVTIREVLNLREIFLMKSPRIKKLRLAMWGIVKGVLS